MTTNPKVDGYIRKNNTQADTLEALRAIVLDCGLVEDIKWRTPGYTLDGANSVMVGAGKDHCVLSFLKGALLKDPKGILLAAGPNSQAAKVIKFTDAKQVAAQAAVLKAYVKEAIAAEKAGLKVEYKKITEHAAPAELTAQFKKTPALKKAFESLTPGRQRGYLLHFSGAKQSKTRVSRIEKCMPMILAGKGLND